LKLLQNKIRNILYHIGTGNNFLNRTPIAQQLRERINKWDLHETKKLLHSKGNGHQTEEAVHRMGENLCQVYF
jgi:hypothetical protein